ncbi:something about silencing protein 10 [Paecilomyces lecythidis]|uniref:Something about silencing protein 10 n=1 Tax=Paecilomyces lecythidis TaxID=3004212 RepID=A0ABR3YCN1_9EURO
MAKKRKASGRGSDKSSAKQDAALNRSKFAFEERFDDSEDDFETGRDQILLEEGPEAKRRRKLQEKDDHLEPSDEEVLGYESVDEDELDDEDDFDDEDDIGSEEGFEQDGGRNSKKSRQSRDSSSPVSRAGDDEEEEEGIAAWGTSRKDLYNADNIETEADALEEEEEAKKLQQKHLKSMKEEDFGFDETEWLDAGKEDEGDEDAGEVMEVLPQLEVTDDMSPEEQLKILKSRYPEFEPLAKDFADLQATHKELQQAAKEAEGGKTLDPMKPTPVSVTKLRALSAYLGTISLYFVLLTSPAQNGEKKPTALPAAQLRDHSVMGSLIQFRKLWESVKDLREPTVVDDVSVDEDESDVEMEEATPKTAEKNAKGAQSSKSKKLSKAQRAAEAAKAEAEARRAERLRETEAGLADLSDLLAQKGKQPKTKKSKVVFRDQDSDFGDEDALTTREAEEKAKQRRSLRFYTSQLAQKANKRGAAGRDAGGDADLPYRERLKDRQARLNAQAEKRGRQQADELGVDSDDEDHRVAGELRREGGGSDEDEYYDMVASKSKQRKADKKARAEAYAQAAREGGHVEIQEEIGPDGKRAITYQIEKNKGLAPKRNKDVRNPRVKKRKKYEQKQKKLGSVRQVYKGGEGRGGYAGELTGIKKNLVKSVKL